ncbi:MAG: SirB2 family protein [Bacteroidia bacterium]
MYTGLLHTHRLVVILFLIIYLIKIVLLLLNKKESLDSFTKKFRIPEMIVSGLFLLTGIGLLVKTAAISPMLIGKIVLVLAAIPLAVVGFRKQNKLLATLSVVLLIAVYGLAEMDKTGVSVQPLATEIITDPSATGYDAIAHGKALFERNCIVCHGAAGNMQGSGAKDLTISELDATAMKTLVLKGKNAMPAYEKFYSAPEIDAVVQYVRTLKK